MVDVTYEVFHVIPSSLEQEEDAGWYFVLRLGQHDLGDPHGPFPTLCAAHNSARSVLITE